MYSYSKKQGYYDYNLPTRSYLSLAHLDVLSLVIVFELLDLVKKLREWDFILVQEVNFNRIWGNLASQIELISKIYFPDLIISFFLDKWSFSNKIKLTLNQRNFEALSGFKNLK